MSTENMNIIINDIFNEWNLQKSARARNRLPVLVTALYLDIGPTGEFPPCRRPGQSLIAVYEYDSIHSVSIRKPLP